VGRLGLGQMRDGIAMLTYSNADIVRDNVFVRDGQTWAQLIEQRTGARMRGAPVMRILHAGVVPPTNFV